jgi:hypothetical protein
MQLPHENDRTSQLSPPIENAKCVLSLPDGCEIVRAIETSSETEVCSQMTTFIAVLVARGYLIDKISIFPSANSAIARIKPLQIANMCGKLEHENSMFFFKPFILPLLVTVENDFGHCECLYSAVANIQTTKGNKVSLIRGARDSAALEALISHVFWPGCIISARIHNIMCSAQLPHEVSKRNNKITAMLAHECKCQAINTLLLDDCMFAHSILLDEFCCLFLQQHGVASTNFKSVRINVCRSGVVNFFLAVPGGVEISRQPEHLFLPIVEAMLSAIEKAT